MKVEDALDRALKLMNMARLERAETIAREVVTARPRNPDARNVLGVVLHRAGKIEDAKKSIREAIRLNPEVPNYYCNLGEMERQSKGLDAAATALERAIA